jgi:pyridoxamine 5'-phosphate oxidase
MNREQMLNRARALVSSEPYAVMGTVGKSSIPSTRAMTVLENEGLDTVWFATGLFTQKVENLRQNPATTLFFADSEDAIGVTLVGTTDVLLDSPTRERFWRPGLKKWFLQGAADPNYCILRFHTKQVIFSLERKATTIDL